MSDDTLIYSKPDDVSIKQIGYWLSSGQNLIQDPPVRVMRAYLDSFDWRLYKAGTVLEAATAPNGHLLTWRRLHSGEILGRLSVKQLPHFIRDLTSPGLQRQLKPILSVRALLKKVSVISRTQSLRQVNRDEKTLFRLELRQDAVTPQDKSRCVELPASLHLFPYRGYEKELARMQECLAGKRRLSVISEDPMLTACGCIGLEPGAYSNKPDFRLDPNLPTHDTLRTILKTLLENVRANIDGVRDDLDPEFLHDFLLAIRRSRCLLQQFPDVFPEEGLRVISQDFDWLVETATPTRDLAIFLPLFDNYWERLPEEHRPGLRPIEQLLREEKNNSQYKMRTAFKSPRYDRLMEKWWRFLDSSPAAKDLPPQAGRPTRWSVRKHIWDSYQKVLDNGKGIRAESAVTELLELHQLCKTLGYQMEVFRRLFPEKRYAKIRAGLVRLMDYLNLFHDLELQHRALKEFTERMMIVQRVMPASLEAVNLLVAGLSAESEQVRKAFPKQFKLFCDVKMRKDFHVLFQSEV